MNVKINAIRTDSANTNNTVPEVTKTADELQAEHIARITKIKYRLKRNSQYDWQPDEVIEILATSIDILETDENIFSMLGLASKLGLYVQWFGRMKAKYPDNEEIVQGVKIIKELCEYKMHHYSATGIINPVVGIFSLKAYHKRVEQQHVKVESDNKHQHSGTVVLREADGSVFNPDQE